MKRATTLLPRCVTALSILAALLLAAAGPARAAEELPAVVYLPYDQAPNLTTRGQGVFLPYEKFLALWDAANPAHPPIAPALPPIGAALTGFTVSGRVAGESAELALSATATALAAGWSQIELPAELALADFSASDPRLVLERRAGAGGKAGLLALHLPAAGSYHFSAALALPVNRDASGRRSLALVLPVAAAGRLDLVIAGAEAEITLTPLVAATTTSTAGGTRLLAVLGGSPRLAVAWQPPLQEVAGEALLLADGDLRLVVAERSLRYDLSGRLSILRRALPSIGIAIPPETQVLAVEAAGLRTWEKVAGDGGDSVVLHFHEAVLGAQAFTLRLERLLPALAAGASSGVTVGWPAVRGAARATGTISIQQGDGLALAVERAEGLSQVDPGEVPAGSGAIAAFRYLAAPPPALLSITRLQSEVRVGVHQLVHLGSDEDRIAVLLELEVRRAGVFALSCVVPAAWDLVDSAGLALDDLRALPAAGASRRYELALRGRLLGAGELTLRFRAPPSIPREAKAGDAASAIPLSVLAVVDAHPLRGTLAVAAPRSWALSTAERSGLTGAEVETLAHQGPGAVLARELGPDEEMPLAFTFIGATAEVRLLAAPRARELALQVEELITAAEGHLRRHAAIHGEVRYSAASAIRVQAESSADDQLVFKGANLAEHAMVAHEQGLTTWELRFQAPLLGPFTLSVEQLVETPALSAGQPAKIQLAPLRWLDATRFHYLGAIAREGSLEVAGSAAGLDAVAPADLPPGLQGQGVVAGFQGAAPAPIALALVRHDLVALADASVGAAHYAAVLGEDGMARVRADLVLTTRGRPYLEVRLPPGATLLEAAINGRQGRPSRRADGSVVVPLGEGGGLRTLPIALVYEQPLAAGRLGAFGRLALALPRYGAGAEGGSPAPLPVEQVSLALYLPANVAPFAWRGDLARSVPGRDLWSVLMDDLARQRRAPGAAEGALPAQEREDGLTVRLALVGVRYDLERLGDGGTIDLRYASQALIDALALSALVLGASAAWLLRRRGDALGALAGSALVLVLAVGAPWLAAVAGFAAGCAMVLAALGVRAAARAIAAWSARRRLLRSGDPWLEARAPRWPAPLPGGAAPLDPGPAPAPGPDPGAQDPRT